MKTNSSKPVIAYLAQKFPSLTMTFVYREVLALQQAGLDVVTLSIWKPTKDEVSAEARPLIGSTFHIFPIVWSKFLRAHAHFLFTRPVKYLSTLFYVLTRPKMTFSHRYRTFLHFMYAIYLAAEVERRDLCHIHAHFALNAATVALVIGRLLGITYSLTAHANDIFDDPVLLKEKLENAAFVVAISEYNKQYLRQNYAPDKKIDVIHCGLDLGQFRPLPKHANSQVPVILSIGRLVEKKGFPHLIRACHILTGKGYNFKCKIVGDGPQKKMLQQMIAETNLESVVTLEDAVLQEHLLPYWQEAAVFVLPCVIGRDHDRDGIPVVLMEAMALQIPSISTTVSGIPELIKHGHSGLLAPPGDAQALADLIAQLLDDPVLREQLGNNGRVTVAQDFDLHQSARQLINLYEKYQLIEPVTLAQPREAVQP